MIGHNNIIRNNKEINGIKYIDKLMLMGVLMHLKILDS